MSDWLAIVILGIIEGITEFLPVSSTGHLLLAEHWLPRQSDLFNVVIQCGAVVAVLPLFPERVRQVFRVGRDPAARDFVMKLLAAFFITGCGGLVLEKAHFKLTENALPVALALAIGGLLFLLVERWLKGRPTTTEVSWTAAVLVGFGQLVAAIFPGSSRSGTTILVMLALGLGRPAATEFSFLVGIPTMLSAGGLKIFKAFHHPPPGTTPENWGLLLLCTAVSAVVSFIAVKWLLRFVQTHTFVGFGWYRIAAGAAVLALSLA
jgi:undecaprenyl-diphosphatase